MESDRVKGIVSDRLKGSFSEYLKLLKDRPPKFDAEQVEYRRAEGDAACATCRHFFVSKTARRSVCEIFRPDGDASVEPTWTCKFHTKDGVDYPLLGVK